MYAVGYPLLSASVSAMQPAQPIIVQCLRIERDEDRCSPDVISHSSLPTITVLNTADGDQPIEVIEPSLCPTLRQGKSEWANVM